MIGVYILPISKLGVKLMISRRWKGDFNGKALFGKEIKKAEPA